MTEMGGMMTSTVQVSGRFRVRLKPSDLAWLAIAAGVVGYDLSARDGELLSEACDRYLLRRPWLTRAVIAVTALHLANALPKWCDPYSLAFHTRRAFANR